MSQKWTSRLGNDFKEKRGSLGQPQTYGEGGFHACTLRISMALRWTTYMYFCFMVSTNSQGCFFLILDADWQLKQRDHTVLCIKTHMKIL